MIFKGVPEQQSDSTKSSNQESRGPGMTSPGSIDGTQTIINLKIFRLKFSFFFLSGVANVDQERFQRLGHKSKISLFFYTFQ